MKDSTLGAIFVCLAVFLVHRAFDREDGATVVAAPPAPAVDSVPAAAPSAAELQPLPLPPAELHHADHLRRDIDRLLGSGEHLEAIARLLAEAERAGLDGARPLLGEILVLLGEVSIDAGDLDGAELYLMEALDVFQQAQDRGGIATAQMVLGGMHIRSRELARAGSDAYNLLLLARFQLSEFQYLEAESNLQLAIESSIGLRRYGTAASALLSLARLYTGSGRTHDAELARLEAAELLARTGQERRAGEILLTLEAAGADPGLLAAGRDRVERSLRQFNDDVAHAAQAAHYRSLYYHYRSVGRHEQAWSFRVRAANILARASKRAMYFRQPDVMALLYNSNFAMARARFFVESASEGFAAIGESERAGEAASMIRQIY